MAKIAKCSSIRLFKSQIEILKNTDGVKVIDTAVWRYNKQDFKDMAFIDKKEPLEVFSCRRGWNLPDSTIRAILDLHLANPLDYTEEIKRLDEEIKGLTAYYQKIIEMNNLKTIKGDTDGFDGLQ